MQKEKPVRGEPIENFIEGWALDIFGYKVAHYFRMSRCRFTNKFGDLNINPLCGKVTAHWVVGPGNYPHCKTCQKIKDKAI